MQQPPNLSQSLERSRTHNPLFPHRHTHYMSQFDLYLVVSHIWGCRERGRNENVNRLRERRRLQRALGFLW